MQADRRDDSCQRFTRSKGKVEWVDGQREKVDGWRTEDATSLRIEIETVVLEAVNWE